MPLRNVPIRRKLMLITMLTSGVAVLLACLTFTVYDVLALRDTMVDDMSATASIIGENSASALAFNDPEAARQTLRSLGTHPHIVGAAIYDVSGNVFATYGTNGASQFVPPPKEAPGHRFERDAMRLFDKIDLGGETIGALYIESNLDPIYERLRRYALVLILVVITTGTASFLLTVILQRAISTPILQLADAARRVAVEKDYAVRVEPHGKDELGKLVTGFNEMLKEIEQRDLALQQAHDELERRVQERTQELARSLALITATLEASNDGIIALGFDGDVTRWNERYCKMWAFPDAIVQKNGVNSDEVRDWIASIMKDPAQYRARIDQLIRDKTYESFDELELADGRVIERYVSPQRDGDQISGVVVTYRDITERRRAERELEDINKRLLETSRQAGMAEVATGVLHNVGNVLNSVNVSANLIADQVKTSKMAGLQKVAALLREHQHDLAAFISQDVRGKHLPPYLMQLADHLPTEQKLLTSEIETLRSNIDHIKQIVSMQQTYSKVSGVKEVVDMTDLIEDALRMNSGALQRHGVDVMRAFAAVPTINTEKHKILQILINLIANAKYACSESPNPDKRVTLRLSSNDTHIKVEVIDTGVGIAPENLTRIFSHGFTTRKDGHGFGLHSGALTARELGGSLRADSPGLGLGATFTLELPLETEAAQA